ncbi:MAG: hypothetical protein GC203_02575 [Phenylobacterium sp.]|uniref:CoA transferase n=1 Tax=Phenylobacterium sp. TaxID=1871053 RepID=UPI002600C90A|nr:CoA transferase [Phenylobacterium sp.]MBI1196728.1 hypothetical protein [Phenylobacterium sp.]
MSPIAPVVAALSAEVAALTARLGRRVDVEGLGVTDRAGQLALGPPGRLISPNRACRLFRAADGWMALNLARQEDRDLIPAWLGCEFGSDPWETISTHAGDQACLDLVERAALLGLPAAIVGETTPSSLAAPRRPMAPGGRRPDRAVRVVDLSALWAGPMCGAILAAMGAEVTRIDSVRRPDPMSGSTPEFFRRLNGAKRFLPLDLPAREGRERLRDEILAADVLVTGFRPRALPGLGLDVDRIFAANPALVWVAITGHGWAGPGAERVGFGDDAAAAGGLVRWTAGGEPRFLGDALADPVTGLVAAIGALESLAEGGGELVDAALARCAAGAASQLGLRPIPEIGAR